MNYLELFHATLPETALEIAALLVLVVDLGLLRRATGELRRTVAVLLGVLGCGAALWTLAMPAQGTLTFGSDVLLTSGGSAGVAQVGILALTELTLFLLIDAEFTAHAGEFVAVILMATAGGLIISAAQDILVIFIGLELLSLGLYILTAFAKKSARSAEAAIKYYLFGGMSAAFLLFGFSYLYGLTGSTNLHAIALGAITSYGAGSSLSYVALVMIAAGLGFKVAAVPFHLWAPDTYEGAPAPAAAFVASVSKVASFALLIGIGTAIVHAFDSSGVVHLIIVHNGSVPKYIGLEHQWSLLLAVMGGLSIVVGNLVALAQVSVRRLLAYSAVAHSGYILLGLAYFSWSPRSAQAILYYVLTYGLTTIGAFGAVAAVERATGSDRLDAFLGLHKRNGVLAAVMLVLFLSLAGIPPLVGFWAKFNLFSAVLAMGNASGSALSLVALAIAMSAVSLYYYLQVLKRAYVMPGVEETRITVPTMTMAVLVVIALAVLLLGILPGAMQSWIAGFYPGM